MRLSFAFALFVITTVAQAQDANLFRIYEFDSSSLQANSWAEIPGGFEGVQPGLTKLGAFPDGTFSSSSDDLGLLITVAPGEVTISRDFYMGKYEVTQAQYNAVMGYVPANDPDFGVGPNRPVYPVLWFDAARFCNHLSELMGYQLVYDEED